MPVDLLLLRAAGVGVLVDARGPGLPQVLHWGADPGPLEPEALRRLADDLESAVANSTLDEPWPLTLLPGQPDGWLGTPGVAGHRDGSGPFPRWLLDGEVRLAEEPGGAAELTCRGADSEAGLAVECRLRMEPGGLVRVRHSLTNTGDGTYTLAGLLAVLPVPAQAGELLDLTGRWCRERSPQRKPFDHGSHARPSRRGRTGHDATLLLLAGSPGFGFRHGEVWGVHAGWSGNHVHLAERLPEGAGVGGTGVLAAGELLEPGELRLAPGEQYTGPWVSFAYSEQGMDGVSGRIHRWLRARPEHPRRPRPVILNTWEAVYFEHGLDRLTELAEVAARIGVERFVLDDGWFLGRRDDSAGLGDWYVDPAVWPDGLRPLADRVHALGMEFGLWVEPEMVNPDSDLARAHPDWVLGPAPRPGHGVDLERLPRLARGQVVLDVAQPGAHAYLLERLDSLVTEIGVDYLKWDHNRDLVEPLHPGPDGVRRAGVHEQTLAVYRLLDELRRRHPQLEIESCSSGGARVDLGILDRTDRVWASDTTDPVERQAIQRWTGLLLPPELVGAHVADSPAHTTGRASELSFRMLTALVGHAGLEMDLTRCSAEELAALTVWTGLYRQLRDLLHSGELVRADHPDPGALLYGVVAADRREAAFCYARLTSAPDITPGRLRLPGLDPDAEYRVTRREEITPDAWSGARHPSWWQRGGVTARGSALAGIGLPAPILTPAQGVLLHLVAVSAGSEHLPE